MPAPHPDSHMSTDAKAYLCFASDCASCRSPADFNRLMAAVADFLPSGLFLGALGHIDLDQLQITRLMTRGYTDDERARIQWSIGAEQRRVIAKWLDNGEPVVVRIPEDEAMLSPLERDEAHSFALNRFAAHGVIDLVARAGSYFSFGRLPRDIPTDQVKALLTLLVPHLHQALQSLDRSAQTELPVAALLNAREVDLVRLMAAGHSNKQIAKACGKSPETIRNQLHTIFAKLGVSNRAAAVRVAGMRSLL